MGRVAVLGVGLTKFIRDEAEFKVDEAAGQAAVSALRDARMRYKEIEMALCGTFCHGRKDGGRARLAVKGTGWGKAGQRR